MAGAVKLRKIASASQFFMRTYEGLRAAPTEPGFDRHIEAVITLVDACCHETRFPKLAFTACDVYRKVLVVVSGSRMFMSRWALRQ